MTVRNVLSPLEVALCGPKYLDVPGIRSMRRGYGEVDLGQPVAMVVGEAPGPNTSSKCPMFPYPSGSAGGRLLAMSGLAPEEYLRRFARRNLLDVCPASWGRQERERAKAVAREIWVEVRDRGVPVLMLGANVNRAFMAIHGEDVHEFERRWSCGVAWVYLPHPSGRSRRWNDPEARSRGRAVLQALASQALPACPHCQTSPCEAVEMPVEVECHCGARLEYRRGIGGMVEIAVQEHPDMEVA